MYECELSSLSLQTHEILSTRKENTFILYENGNVPVDIIKQAILMLSAAMCIEVCLFDRLSVILFSLNIIIDTECTHPFIFDVRICGFYRFWKIDSLNNSASSSFAFVRSLSVASAVFLSASFTLKDIKI